MLLSICSSVPSCSSHIQASLHANSSASFRKAIEDVHVCLKDGIRAQDVSFKTHAAKSLHSFVMETPDASTSPDPSIFSPYPNKFDDIVRGFPTEIPNNQNENFSCSVGEGNSLYPLTQNLKYVDNLNVSGPTQLSNDIASEITRGVSNELSPNIELPFNTSPLNIEVQNLQVTYSDPTLSGSSSLVDVSTNAVATTEVPNLTNEGSVNVIDGIDDFLSTATDSLDKAQDAFRSSYNSIVSSFREVVESAKTSVDDAAAGLFSSAGNSREHANNELTGISTKLSENIYKTGSAATDVLRRAIIIVEDSLSAAATFVVYSYGSFKSLLPPDSRNVINLSEEKVTQILSPVGDAIQQLYVIIEGFEKNLGLDPSDPIVPFLLFLGSSATLGISYWLFTYGGYSGDLDPELTLELLKNEPNAALIDVRPEDARERDGVPDLRRSARSKYASVILPELDGALRKQLKGGGDVDNALVAVVIRNLKLVKNRSKIIVMDASGEQSKAIARSLKKLGVKNAYLVQGGFKSWIRKGLRVKELKPETTLTVLSEEAEAILEDIKPTPTLVISFGLGILAAGYALAEWEKTLQYIGIFGLGQTIYRRFASYENSEDFKQDVRLLLAPVSLGAQAVSWAAGKLEPNRIGLATSPSSTAVQDRVLKAAAKHESQPSESDETEASSIQSNENLNPSES